MQQRNDSLALQSGLDLGKAHGNQSGFACHRQGIECGVFEQSLGARDELRSATASPFGAMTKRIMCSTGRTARVATQNRSVPLDRGPSSSSVASDCANIRAL
jgi:hypothetical protein